MPPRHNFKRSRFASWLLSVSMLSLALLGACAQNPTAESAASKNAAKVAAAASAAAAAFATPASAPSAAALVLAAANPGAVAAPSTPSTAPTPASGLGSTTRAATTPASAGSLSGPPPFATVIKDARRIDGPLTMWQKEEKVWIELMPEQFGQLFLLSPKIKSGISDAWLLGGLMAGPINGAGGPQLVEFVRIHNQVRLQARNTDVLAKTGTPQARAVADSYSQSLLGATVVASAPHPDRKSVLIEANALFLNDILGIGMMLQRGLRQGYSLDRGNSLITNVRGSDKASILETQVHYFTGSINTPQNTGPLSALFNTPAPLVPRYLPDSRSMLISLHYSLAPLPETPMAPRAADPRLGHFASTVLDFSDDLPLSPRTRHVHRWRLEKKEPLADKSDPVKPITFWIDRNVPTVYRETVRSAILEWNKAFDKIGFSNAISVEQQADDAKFDTLDFGYASVRWMMNADPLFSAIGPSHVDPRTGEILDADIGFEGMTARSVRGVRTQVLAAPKVAGSVAGAAAGGFSNPGLPSFSLFPLSEQRLQGLGLSGDLHGDHSRCQHGALAAEQLGYALDVLDAAAEMEPDSPIAQQFVQDYIKEAIMHEVGHTLGLRHNFRASRAYTEAQLSDAEFTRAFGTAGSVMEYAPVNLPRPGQTGGTPFQTAIGPYDYWAIEYAYKPMPAGASAEVERTELQRIAARSSEPQLAFGTDEDNFFGLDPETMQMDLGADPLVFAGKRLDIARDLFKRQETRVLSPQRDYAVLRRSLGFALGDVGRALGILARQIGGVRTLRDYPGTGRDPLQPVPAKVQRESLGLMSSAMLAPEGLQITPALQRRLAPDFLDRAEANGGPTDFALPQRLLDLQRAVLAYLMSDYLAARVLDSAAKFDKAADAFQLSELYQRLSDDVWTELKTPGTDIHPARRELQRDYINRVAVALLRPTPGARVDARGFVRTQARQLLAKLEAAQNKPAKTNRKSAKPPPDSETRAHLADSIDTLRQAMTAVIPRQGL
jgi:hypothetical protein